MQLAPAAGCSAQLPPSGDLRVDWQGRFAYIVAPEAMQPGQPVPLLLALHGCWAEKKPEDVADYVASYRRLANEANIVAVIPISREHTWDFITSQCTKRVDLDFLEVAIDETRKLFPIDDGRIAVVGLSDGASYGLSLALNNPDVFQAAILWATGFCQRGSGCNAALGPQLFMWHGTEDQVFNFQELALPLRDSLLASGYSVEYHAEEGGRHKGPSTDSEFMRSGLKFWFALPRRC